MFTAIQPIEFSARASITSGILHFETTKTLLRFKQVAGHPNFLLPQGVFIDGPWKITELAPTASARVVVLKLDGPIMNDLVAAEPEHPLYNAFLDRLTYELPVNLGPFPVGPGEPPCEDPVVIYTLFLKLSVFA